MLAENIDLVLKFIFSSPFMSSTVQIAFNIGKVSLQMAK